MTEPKKPMAKKVSGESNDLITRLIEIESAYLNLVNDMKQVGKMSLDIQSIQDTIPKMDERVSKIEKTMHRDQEDLLKGVNNTLDETRKLYVDLKRFRNEIHSVQKTVTGLICCIAALATVQFIMFLIR